ncbi:hypothetical protein L1987_67093 [Smallanthus sonchifolius]|uniref:Uncharacterized protein n=1 Tax=Smallanthus sonchifolius TaxID=185202 RepID=A0ACB9BZ68_9ASTR|nr:hypothetical protein L1987_67093 [Smallanthus sonchifolius]
MADSTTITCVKHIETYVDSASSKSPSQQDASLDALAKLLMNDMITLELLVREMEMYLTTTDNVIRARGILLLAELLTRISSKTLENNTIHSLIGFFADRLSDWRALRGALVGCLALMRRKSGTGAISGSDANAVAQSFMQNIQVQSLGQHDRKLCFEILECLIDSYPDTVLPMEEEFVYVICEAIDDEKDPQCLLITFHLVEILAKLYPESSSSLASYAEDLFNILGSYFPIHFTHPKGDDDVKREELSRALMLAFASTPLFEPFAIPLLLEKLSSSLPSAKIESLKYLKSTHNIYTHSGVRGLQILASFPGNFLPVSKSTFKDILVEFISVIIIKFNNASIWRSVLNALVEISSLIEKYDDFEKMASFDVIVVERMLALLSSDDLSMPFSLKVEAISTIGMTNLKYMLKIVQELDTAISASLLKYWLDGNSNSAEHAMLLLECYVDKVLPWFQNTKDTDNVPMHFALKIWDEIEDNTLFCDSLNEKKLLETTMNGMKHAVASSSKFIPLMVDGLAILSEDVQNRDIVYNLLLVLSGILTDKNGQEVIVENAYPVIMCLNKLVFYQHMMLVRETAIQCLTAMSDLPYARVYRFRPEVLQALSRALDDPKRSVRQEAVRCRQAWASISSRSL